MIYLNTLLNQILLFSQKLLPLIVQIIYPRLQRCMLELAMCKLTAYNSNNKKENQLTRNHLGVHYHNRHHVNVTVFFYNANLIVNAQIYLHPSILPGKSGWLLLCSCKFILVHFWSQKLPPHLKRTETQHAFHWRIMHIVLQHFIMGAFRYTLD